MTTINSLVCALDANNNLTVKLVWDVVGPGTVTILDAGGSPVSGKLIASTNGAATWQPAPNAMVAGQPYWARVTVAQLASDRVPLLWSAPGNLSSVFSGDSLLVSWTAPSGQPTPGNYLVSLQSGQVTQSVLAPGTSVLINAPFHLPTGGNWVLTVTPTTKVSQGFSVTGSVLTAPTAVAAINCLATGSGSGTLSITPAPSSYTQFKVTLSQFGVPVLSASLPYGGQALNLPVPAPLWPLSAAGGYEVTLQGSAPGATGPTGSGLPVLVTAPRIVSAQLDSGTPATVSVVVTAPPGTPQPTGFSATVLQGGTAVGNGWFIGNAGTVSLTGSYNPATATTLNVAAVSGSTISGPVSSVNLITGDCQLQSLDYDAGILTVKWASAAGIGSWQVTASNGSTVLGQVDVSSLSTRLSVAPVPYSVSVRGVQSVNGTRVFGPASSPVAGLFTATTALGVGFSVGGVATLSWLANADVGVNGYSIVTFDGAKVTGNQAVDGAGTLSVVLPAAVVGAGSAGLAHVRATGVAANGIPANGQCTLLGPRSQSVPILGNPASQLVARYDGAIAHVQWVAPAGEAVQGYLVTLTDTSGGVPSVSQRTSACSIELAYKPNANSVVTVTVQATGANALGAPVSTLLFQPGLFLSTASQAAPYLWPSSSFAFGPQALVWLLPAILTAPKSPLPSNGSFALETATQAPWAYTLTIKSTGPAWTFNGDAIRSALQLDITDFLTQMVAQGLTPQGDLQLRQAFARLLPLTFVESLYYGYGFNVADEATGKGFGQVDLSPGMVLQAEFESYQALPQSLQEQGPGMVGANVTRYEIGSYRAGGQWRQGFDAFLSRLVGHGTLFPGPVGGRSSPAQSGAGGLPDLYYTDFLQPFFRLLYPVQFLPSVDPSVSENLRDNVTLIAAGSRADLDQATAVLRDPSSAFQPVQAVYFRGRAMITPNIHVSLNQQDLIVPLGTTVANVLERHARRNLSGQGRVPVTLTRGTAGVAIAGWPDRQHVSIRLDWAGGVIYPAGDDWLDLPLLHGDSLTLALD